jgi:hypothetical protein
MTVRLRIYSQHGTRIRSWWKVRSIRKDFSTGIPPKSAKDRTKFIALDYGTSGHFLVDRKTEQVYSIKGYGVANLKKPRGTVEFLTKFINTLTEQGKEYMSTYWYKLHVTDKDLGVFCKEVDGRILISGIDYNGNVKLG